jgi:hypothetical protein
MGTEKTRKVIDRRFKSDAVSLVINGQRSVLEVVQDSGIEYDVPVEAGTDENGLTFVFRLL